MMINDKSASGDLSRPRPALSCRETAKPESGPHPKAITYGLTVKVPLHHADLVALFVFNFWDAVGAIGELEDLLWSG